LLKAIVEHTSTNWAMEDPLWRLRLTKRSSHFL